MTIRCLSWRGSSIGDLKLRTCRQPNRVGARSWRSQRRSRKRNNRKKRKRRRRIRK